ncbi:MAG: hypothetical protein H0U98_18445 [Alphaproteobacteria bacterium]|nr:hypothetical protein [Alphaproteobacteria bacterium]
MIATDQMVHALANTRKKEITPHTINLMTTDLNTIAFRLVAISALYQGAPVPLMPLPAWGWQYRPGEQASSL